MSRIEFLVSTVGIHTSEDRESVGVRGFEQFAQQVASIQCLWTVLERVLAGVVGNDASRVNNDSLDPGAFPMLAPPEDIVITSICLCDIGLAPPQDPAEPGFDCQGG